MSGAMASLLERELSTLALIWRLRRWDGVQLGFTSHDRPIRRDGMDYASSPGLAMSAIRISRESGQNLMTLTGAFHHTAIRRDDVEMGRWANAMMEASYCDWTCPDRGSLLLVRGRVAQCRLTIGAGAGFQFEIETEERAQPIAAPPRLSPLCRSRLGDGRCGVSMEKRRIFAHARQAGQSSLAVLSGIPSAELFLAGRVRFLDGQLAGIERSVEAVDGETMHLDAALPRFSAAVRVRLEEGCDGRLQTCRQRFSNASAFDGEPQLPGRDALVRYGIP